jgi:hypothetical protein
MVNEKYKLLDLAYRIKQPKSIDYNEFLKTVPFKFRKLEAVKNLWDKTQSSNYKELLSIHNL